MATAEPHWAGSAAHYSGNMLEIYGRCSIVRASLVPATVPCLAVGLPLSTSGPMVATLEGPMVAAQEDSHAYLLLRRRRSRRLRRRLLQPPRPPRRYQRRRRRRRRLRQRRPGQAGAGRVRPALLTPVSVWRKDFTVARPLPARLRGERALALSAGPRQ